MVTNLLANPLRNYTCGLHRPSSSSWVFTEYEVVADSQLKHNSAQQKLLANTTFCLRTLLISHGLSLIIKWLIRLGWHQVYAHGQKEEGRGQS
jgi:hypothetical protein